MNPNQQPGQPQPPQQPQPMNPYPLQQSVAPQTTPAYPNTAPQPAFDPNYLDSIAPPPPKPSFLSGSFGKIFFILLGVFVIAVSLIVAFSGQKKTADLELITVRLDNFSKTIKSIQPNLKSNNLSATNTNLGIWATNAQVEAEALLGKAGVKKTDYDKKMVASEKKIVTDLDAKFEDSRLSGTLNRIYASTMAVETQKLVNLYNTMAKKSGASAIRDYAKNASKNLSPIQKSFDSFNDDGN